MDKSWRNMIIFVGCVLVVFFLIAVYFSNQNKGNQNKTYPTSQENPQSNTDKLAGINDIVNAGHLSFQLTDVELYTSNYSDGNTKTMWWRYTISNEGKDVENASDCGVLLFEDGAQYRLQVSDNGNIMDKCHSYEMVPGARISLWYGFRFSNSPYAKLWNEVPGSKITFFSQQTKGLVKYTIEKSQIRYTN